MYCPKCDADVIGKGQITADCPSCAGTGIGHAGTDTKCGECYGRGYVFVKEYYVCELCDEVLEDEE